MSIKAIFFDLDGTLTDLETNIVPESTKEAMRSARANGVKLFLATGRHPMLFKKSGVVDDLPLDAFLTANGQYCYNDKEVFHRKTIDKNDKIALLKQFQTDTHPVPILYLAENEMYINLDDERVHKADNVLKAEQAPVKDPAISLEHDIYALLLYGGHEENDHVLSVMPNSKSVRWHPTFSDVIPKDGGKDKGIDAILTYYGIDLSETMAFGDADNDMPMIKHVNVGIAMGNATDNVKAIADDVTSASNQDGIYKALKKWHVI